MKEFIDFGFQVSIWNHEFVRFKSDLAAESALSFPLTPMRLGIQHIIISLLFDIESSLLNSLIIRGLSSFLLLTNSKTESESENMIDLLCLFFEISRANMRNVLNSINMLCFSF